MLTRPAHAFVTGPQRAARAKTLKGEVVTYLAQRREQDAIERRTAVEQQLERQRQAAEAAAAATAAAPPKPVAQMSPAEFKMAQRQFVRSLRGA